MKQQNKRSKKVKLGVYLVAPFVAFYRALKPDVMGIEELEPKENQVVYFDFKQQVFIVEDKDRELLVEPTILFYAGSKTALKTFFKQFNIAFKHRKQQMLNEDFFKPLLETNTTYNKKPLLV